MILWLLVAVLVMILKILKQILSTALKCHNVLLFVFHHCNSPHWRQFFRIWPDSLLIADICSWLQKCLSDVPMKTGNNRTMILFYTLTVVFFVAAVYAVNLYRIFFFCLFLFHHTCSFPVVKRSRKRGCRWRKCSNEGMFVLTHVCQSRDSLQPCSILWKWKYNQILSKWVHKHSGCWCCFAVRCCLIAVGVMTDFVQSVCSVLHRPKIKCHQHLEHIEVEWCSFS